MKTKHLFVTLAIALTTGLLSSCGDVSVSPSESPSVSESPSISESTSTSVERVDYVSQTKLTLDYTDHDFLADGIGQVTVYNCVDGDTVHFRSSISDTLIKARFVGVDTPESTGIIQPWGKAASKFTKEKVTTAKKIVLSSESESIAPAVSDSTGTRYLAFVWVSYVDNPTLNDFSLLNLWLVQEGYSTSKGISTSKYASVFYSADLQAQGEKQHIWSDDPDPGFYYGAAIPTDLRDINTKPDEYLYDVVGKSVYFEGIVAKIIGNDCYVVKDFINDDTGLTERYGMYIFTQYKNYSPIQTVGNEVGLTGNITSFNGNYQCVNVSYSEYFPKVDDIKLISKGNAIDPLTYTAKEASASTSFNIVVTIEGLHGVSGYNGKDDPYDMTIVCADSTGNTINLRVDGTVWVVDRHTGLRTTDINYFLVSGETFNITGALVKYNEKAQVALCNKNDIIFNG